MHSLAALALGSTILAAAPLDTARPPQPQTVSREVPQSLRFKISYGLSRAQRSLANEPGCSQLFTDLGSDGEATLRGLRFDLASAEQQRSICREHSAALFMNLGGHEVRICPQRFSRVPAARAASLLLHEALHSAGLEEHPHRSDALQSRQLTRLVREVCRL